MKLAGPKNDDYVTIAQGLDAAERLNKDLLEEGGHRWEYARQPDGNLTFAYKQIWSDEEVQKKKESDAEVIIKSIGTRLFEDSSAEGHRLFEFLVDIHRASPEHDPETPMSLGKLWFACVNFAQENPDSDISKEFTVLNDAYSATNHGLET